MRINRSRDVEPLELAKAAHAAQRRHLIATGTRTEDNSFTWDELPIPLKTSWLSVVYALAAELDPDRWNWVKEEMP